jgi:hypothetical protein
MMDRRATLFAGIALVAGCGHRLSSPEDYDEVVDSLAVSPSGDSLVVVGRAFHYVFRPPQPLAAALQSELRKVLSAEFEGFELHSATDIRGRWSLLVAEKDIDPGTANLAASLGFTRNGSGPYVLKGAISGTRYAKSNIKAGPTERTNKTYRIHVSHSRQFREMSSLQNSPVSGGSNGALILGLVVLLPLIILLNPCITCK